MFKRPIPGQSLVSEPKAMPFERPPEVSDPEQALQIHLERLSRPDVMEAALSLLVDGLDLVTVVEGITRAGVANGIHSLDVSLIINPVIHEFIKTTADAVGIDYEEGFEEDQEVEKELRYRRQQAMSDKMLDKLGFDTEDVVSQIKEAPEETVEEQPARGLMARM